MIKPTKNYRASAFTMLEVLFAGTILALATFMVLGLLKLSDEMSYRAKVDSKLSQIMKTRAAVLINCPFERLRTRVSSFPAVVGNPNKYQFQNGAFDSSYFGNSANAAAYTGNNTPGFPFVELIDPFDYGSVFAFTSPKHLLSGKPLPGTTAFRPIFPFREVVTLTFDSNISTATSVEVLYEIWWVNEFIRSTQTVEAPNAGGTPSSVIDFEKLGGIAFEFTKHDTSTY